jgi:hypothetical protein
MSRAVCFPEQESSETPLIPWIFALLSEMKRNSDAATAAFWRLSPYEFAAPLRESILQTD